MTRYERIIAARNAGGSWADIATAFGITESAARGMYSRSRTPERLAAHRLAQNAHNSYRRGLSRRPALERRKFDRDVASALRSQGWTLASIAAKLGVHESTICRAVK